MKLIAHTQIRENYGAHDWNGEGECPQYWKNKGGDAVVLADLTTQQAIDIAAAGNMRKLVQDRLVELDVEERNEAFEVYVIGWELVEAGDIEIVWDHNNANRHTGSDKVTTLMMTRDDLNYQGSIVQQMGGRRRHGYYFAKVS
jgi:hypothetical protein